MGVSSPVAASVELHEMKMDGSVMRMRPVASIDLPKMQDVELKPGGYHVMLMGLKGQLKAGDKVPLTLKIEQGGKVTEQRVEAEVRDLGAMGQGAMGQGGQVAIAATCTERRRRARAAAMANKQLGTRQKLVYRGGTGVPARGAARPPAPPPRAGARLFQRPLPRPAQEPCRSPRVAGRPSAAAARPRSGTIRRRASPPGQPSSLTAAATPTMPAIPVLSRAG